MSKTIKDSYWWCAVTNDGGGPALAQKWNGVPDLITTRENAKVLAAGGKVVRVRVTVAPKRRKAK